MTDGLDQDEKLRKLLRAGATVLRMFRSGHHPTENQLGRLEGCILAFTAMKTCGHQLLDDCDCLVIEESNQ